MKNMNEVIEWGPFVGDLSGCYWQNDECYLSPKPDDVEYPPVEVLKGESDYVC